MIIYIGRHLTSYKRFLPQYLSVWRHIVTATPRLSDRVRCHWLLCTWSSLEQQEPLYKELIQVDTDRMVPSIIALIKPEFQEDALLLPNTLTSPDLEKQADDLETMIDKQYRNPFQHYKDVDVLGAYRKLRAQVKQELQRLLVPVLVYPIVSL